MASFVFLSAALGAVVTATAPAARPAAAEPSPRASSVKIYRALSTDACEALAASLSEANAQQNGTRWLSAETTPTTPLERAVRAVFDLHTSNLEYDAAISGAEYWVQSHVEAGDAPSNGIALHRDFDLGVLEEDGRGGDVEAALRQTSPPSPTSPRPKTRCRRSSSPILMPDGARRTRCATSRRCSRRTWTRSAGCRWGACSRGQRPGRDQAGPPGLLMAVCEVRAK